MADAAAGELITLDELATRAGVPSALLDAAVREGLVVPRRADGEARFAASDAQLVRAGLELLEAGLPLPELLTLARRHTESTRAIAEDAVALFDTSVRQPLLHADLDAAERAQRLVATFRTLLPSVTTLVEHHFRAVLLQVAQEHLESVGEPAELRRGPRRAGLGRTDRAGRLVTSSTRGRVDLPEGDEKRAAVDTMFDRIAPRYDRMNRLISLGQDARWRRRVVDALELAPRARVLDLGCGTGDLCRELVRAGYEPVGVDRSAGMLATARVDVPLARADAVALPVVDASLDGVVSAFVFRNVVDLDAVLADCARALRPGGRLAVLDAAVPDHAVLRWGNAVWFRGAVPLLGRLVARDDAYGYLPRSIAYLPPPDELAARLAAAGFGAVSRRTMTGGSVQLLTGTRA